MEGFRYVRGAPKVRSVLIRTGAFSVGATSLLALLPVVCQPHGAQGYGFLLTCFGLGALAGAAVLPRLRVHLFGGWSRRRRDRCVCSYDLRRRASAYL